MKISNEFFIEQIRSTQKLVEADAIPDETSVMYVVTIDDQTIMSVYGDKDKTINTCFTILEEIFKRHPSEFIPVMMEFVGHIIRSYSSEKIEGDPS